ncbi:MAG: hypothetical protein ACKOC8_05470 [Pirellulales bacterium]
MSLPLPARWFAILAVTIAAFARAESGRSPDAADPGAVQAIDDYAAAGEAARQAGAMLLVSIAPGSDGATDVVGERLASPEMQERFTRSGVPWVICRLSRADTGTLVSDPSLVEMRGGPGVFVVDHSHEEWRGRVVSILPRTSGRYYRFEPHHVDELASLPPASLTQRSMILAVRLHAEQPRSTEGTCEPGLCTAAAAHSAHQARIHRQGHHGWETRSRQLGGAVAEVCAESWEHQDLLDSCVDCVASWRQSPGHWRAVSGTHAAYGYDIRRGTNGIWYATGIFRE